jgi:hypothetical protein
MNAESKRSVMVARAIVTAPSSSGCRRISRTSWELGKFVEEQHAV